MLLIAIASALASAAVCFAIGRAVIAPRDSYLRTRRGILFLVIGTLSLVFLPPQLPALESAIGSVSGSLGGDLGSSLTWPTALSPGTYITIWIVTSLLALLIGMKVWNAGQPGWRAASSGVAFDSSASSRAAALIAMADSLDDMFDAIRRTSLDAKGVDRIAEEIRTVGRRYGTGLPEESGAAYALVASKVPAALAPGVTRYLLEGAGRSSQIANVARR